MDEEEHMNALRDYFIKKGITQEAAIHVTNRMVEGKYPDRQAWRVEDGILVTWPSPQHMQDAMKKNPEKYTTKEPNPKVPDESPKEPIKQEPTGTADKGDEENPEDTEDAEDDSLPKSSAGGSGGSIFGGEKSKDVQGGKSLDVEPTHGETKPEPPPQPASPTIPPAPRTPERVAAEKEVVKQILATDDNALSNVANPLNLKETALNHQLNELYKQADQWGFREAITFLTPYVKP
jgi:hypothetical protein